MSAVPVAALVLGGTCALPSSAPFILWAKGGPAKAIAAPSASVTSMVLFDMVFLPVDVSLKTTIFRIYSRNVEERPEISWKPMAQSTFILIIELRRPELRSLFYQ